MKEEWRKAILEGWEKYGTGVPLSPKLVDHLANEFSKPIVFPLVTLKRVPESDPESTSWMPWRIVNTVEVAHAKKPK